MFKKLKSKRRKRNTNIDINIQEVIELNELKEEENAAKDESPQKEKTWFLFDSYNGLLNRRKTDRNESQIDSVTDLTENCDSNIVYPSHRPQDSNLSQQNLPAWKPLLTPKFVINLFLICSIIFIPIGIILYYTSLNIYEFKEEYTDCLDLKNSNLTCYEQLLKNISYKCTCRIHFTWNRYQDETLFVYYMLENFYQNQRRFDKSRDHEQLLSVRKDNYLSSDCEPFRYIKDKNDNLLKIAPCGSVANSLFNDTFNVFYLKKISNESVQLNISKANLAWDSDRQFKYKNPSDFKNTVKPPNWSHNISQIPGAYKNEDLMVWMRSSAFPTFRKLNGRILIEENTEITHHHSVKSNQSSQNSINRLPKGHYYVDINYRYQVKQFGGKKYFILANVSWTGGRCFFLAFMYIIVGSLCFITAVFLFFLHIYWGHMDYNTVLLLQQQQQELIQNQNIIDLKSNC